jgi:hypothetical protein
MPQSVTTGPASPGSAWDQLEPDANWCTDNLPHPERMLTEQCFKVCPWMNSYPSPPNQVLRAIPRAHRRSTFCRS